MNPILIPLTNGLQQNSEWFPNLQPIFQRFINWADGALFGVGVFMVIVAAILMLVQSKSRHAEGTGAMFGKIIAALLIGGMALGIVDTIYDMGATPAAAPATGVHAPASLPA